MKCMSNELLCILPPRFRSHIPNEVLNELQEIRLRMGKPVMLHSGKGIDQLKTAVCPEDISYVINAASRYSPWNAVTMASGFLTAPGGHRIGICGEAVLERGKAQGIRVPMSLCIRVAKDFPGIGRAVDLRDSVLIIGPPGSGKTTLLRDLVRRISSESRGIISVIDERGEIFPQVGGKYCFDPGEHADILSGCPKSEGIEMVLRTMGPHWIAVDEVTAARDCDALVQAGWCGVKLLATVHAAGIEDLRRREIYRPLVQTKLFQTVIVLGRDKSVRFERVVL